MPLVSGAVHEHYHIGELLIGVNDIAARRQPAQRVALQDAHVKYTLASRPLSRGTVYCAFGSSVTYLYTSQSGRNDEIHEVSSDFCEATTKAFSEGRKRGAAGRVCWYRKNVKRPATARKTRRRELRRTAAMIVAGWQGTGPSVKMSRLIW